jgi:hypothetical protein
MFAATWLACTSDYADRMNNTRKYVFSSTLDTAEWTNSVISAAIQPTRSPS